MRFATILAGGSGIRLWPLSRNALPKQLIPLFERRSLLEEAFDRLEGVLPSENRWVCGAAPYEMPVRERIPALSMYIGEPVSRDTLAAIGISCALAYALDQEAIVAFLTSDHVIQPVAKFQDALSHAFAIVEKNPNILLTFGVKPRFAATAYGYLELGAPLSDPMICHVRRFKEKPDSETAGLYFAAGESHYLWNSGMFVWRASRFLDLLEKYEPKTAVAVRMIAAEPNLEKRIALMAAIYPTITKKSVDYGIMEPASQDRDVSIACLPLDLDWMDIGSWDSFASLAKMDREGNTFKLASREGENTAVVLRDTMDTLVVSTDPDHLVACLGCKDMVIIHTADATLICPKTQVEEVKKLHAEVANKFGARYL